VLLPFPFLFSVQNIRKKEAERIRRQQREKEEQLKKERQQLALEQARERNLSQRHAKFVRLRAKIELYRRADETADQSKKVRFDARQPVFSWQSLILPY